MERTSISRSLTETMSPAAFTDQSPRAGGDVRNWSISRIRFVFPDNSEGLAPTVVALEGYPMPKRDCAELHRRRNDLSCPQTIGEISRFARGNRESATTFSGFDLLRGVVNGVRFRQRLGQRFQSWLRRQIRMRWDRPVGQLDLRGRFGALFSGKGHAHRFDFLWMRLPVVVQTL
jgi:hypothetical protein